MSALRYRDKPVARRGTRACGRTAQDQGWCLGDRPRAVPDSPFEDRERHCALAHHLVELSDVELRAEALFRFVAGAHPGGVPDLVAAGLADHRAVALDFALRPGAGIARRLRHVVGGLFAAPALGMDAGVDDEARRPEQEALQEAGAAERVVGIDAKLVGKLFGVKGPTL